MGQSQMVGQPFGGVAICDLPGSAIQFAQVVVKWAIPKDGAGGFQ
jgi:hypothetical protein